MHFWLAFCYCCCLFSVRYRCIWGRCGRCSVPWHPDHWLGRRQHRQNQRSYPHPLVASAFGAVEALPLIGTETNHISQLCHVMHWITDCTVSHHVYLPISHSLFRAMCQRVFLVDTWIAHIFLLLVMWLVFSQGNFWLYHVSFCIVLVIETALLAVFACM